MSDGPSPILPTPAQPQPAPKDYFIGFNFLIDRQATMTLLAAVSRAIGFKAKSITICMSSHGGAPDQATYAYHILSGLPATINTHAIGTIQSAAVPIFMAGQNRFAAGGASFLFHETVLMAGGGSQPMSRDHLAGQVAAISLADEWSAEIVASRSGTPKETVREWFIGQSPRDAAFAVANGVVTELRPLVIPPDAEFYQLEFKF
jgi:ATP-dependent protease ClpP protease subunit